ncbi:MAG: outer membrane protein assembly factor BamD [bacterium]|nr:outer membrane protein assembly factor BamD [bacterium]
MKSILYSALFVCIAVVFASCSEYNEVLKGDDYERKIQKADEYYQAGVTPKIKYRKSEKAIQKKGLIRKEKYRTGPLQRSVALYEQIYQRMPKGAEGELAYFRIGKAYYYSNDFYMAGYYLSQFPQRFPFSAKGEEAMFLSAMCSVNNSPASSLDQTDTELAIRDLQSFIDQYPQSNLVDSCNSLIDGLRFKLEKKDYESVLLYDKTANYNAAVTSAETFIEDFPISRYKEDVLRIAVENSYLLAKNSVENKKEERINNTIERYNNFVAQFPESRELNRFEKMIDELKEMRKELTANKSNKN